MKMPALSAVFTHLLVPLLLGCAALLGCGGGSSGTGGRELDGAVYRDLTPLTDVTITTVPPTSTAMTDQQGNFTLTDLPYTSPLRLQFDSPGSFVVVDLVNIPENTERISMHCNYDEASGTFEVSSASYIGENGVAVPGSGIVVSAEEKH